jgi:hypothetical protein
MSVALLVVFLVVFVLALVVNFALLHQLRVPTQAWRSNGMNKWDPPVELMTRLEEAIGPESKPRTLPMIKEFLDWFNSKKESWGGVTDEQLEILIKAHISDWSIPRKLSFKFLIDEYKELERIRKANLKQKQTLTEQVH